MTRTASRITTWALALSAAALSLGGAGALSSCGDNTGVRHVSFAARAGGFEHSDPAVRFTTRTGWTVTLSEAHAAVGPIYLNALAPIACDGCQTRSILDSLGELVVPRAWAHGESHLGAGQIVGQVTRQIDVDVLSPSLVEFAGGGDGLDQRARSAEAWLYNRDGATGGAAIRVRGSASRESDGGTPEEVAFSGALVINESIATPQTPLDLARRVRGIPVDLTPSDGGSLTVRIDPTHWFDGADFSELEAVAVDARGDHPFTRNDNVGRAFLDAARASRGVFAITFSAR